MNEFLFKNYVFSFRRRRVREKIRYFSCKTTARRKKCAAPYPISAEKQRENGTHRAGAAGRYQQTGTYGKQSVGQIKKQVDTVVSICRSFFGGDEGARTLDLTDVNRTL